MAKLPLLMLLVVALMIVLLQPMLVMIFVVLNGVMEVAEMIAVAVWQQRWRAALRRRVQWPQPHLQWAHVMQTAHGNIATRRWSHFIAFNVACHGVDVSCI